MTAARSDKWEVGDNPASGADVWLMAPLDKNGIARRGDIHISLEEAEQIRDALNAVLP